jgi:hypothetical protein
MSDKIKFCGYIGLDFSNFNEAEGYSFPTWECGEWQLQDRGSYFCLNKGSSIGDERITIKYDKEL